MTWIGKVEEGGVAKNDVIGVGGAWLGAGEEGRGGKGKGRGGK